MPIDPIFGEINKINQEIGKLMERLNRVEEWILLHGEAGFAKHVERGRIESDIRTSHNLGG